jgi:2-iminobutanoate/2-iminopropanoate deaminase
MTFINPADVPPLSSAYSQAVMTDSHIFVSGLVSVNGKGEKVGVGDISIQTTTVLTNMERILKEADGDRRSVVSVTAYITDFALYGEYAYAYAQFFGDHRPARATVRADLVDDAFLVEMQAIALR